MDLFLHVAGALIVLVSLHDIFFTVLFPASRRGPIREPLAGPGMLSGSSASGLLASGGATCYPTADPS